MKGSSRVARALRSATAGRRFARCLLLATVVALSPLALAQVVAHPPMSRSEVPPPPSGDAVIRGTVIDAANPGATSGLDVALYALRADGQPGIARTRTDEQGSFAFERISAAPDIVYLVGVRYAEVPYGERVAFAPGQNAIDVPLEVVRPVATSNALRVGGSEIEIAWRGTRIVVSEEHRIVNPGPAVVFVTADRRGSVAPPLTFALPAGYENLETPLGTNDDGFEPRGAELAYWGPVYAGEQTIRFGYLLPAAAAGEPVAFDARFPGGTGSLLVRTLSPGPAVSSPDLSGPRSVVADDGTYEIHETGALARDARVRLVVALPETTSDPNALRLGTSELTLELDDAVLTVTQLQRIVVAPGAHVAGAPDAPLLRFALPAEAEFEGLTADASRLGIGATPAGIDVLGPLGPGEHEFAYRYRIPAAGAEADLELEFPLLVPTLAVSVADTGVLIDGPRFHRLRPRKQGTRTWLLREAFQIEPGERVALRLEALSARAVPASASLAAVLCLGALLTLFVVSPLRARRAPGGLEHAAANANLERELVYATIRDLDHDHETGKLADEEHARARAELRAQAVELLRAERGMAPDASEGAPFMDRSTDRSTDRAADSSAAHAAVSLAARRGASEAEGAGAVSGPPSFCSHCGGRIQPYFRFCSHCGGRLAEASGAGDGGPAA